MPSPSHDQQAEQRPSSAARRPRARLDGGAAPQLNVLARLQRAAGNAAVGSLLARRASPVQRQPDTSGWKGADATGGGWNAKAQEVQGTGIERIPVEGLKYGNKESFSSGFAEVKEDKEKGIKGRKADPSTERSKTTESAAGRAVVLLPL